MQSIDGWQQINRCNVMSSSAPPRLSRMRLQGRGALQRRHLTPLDHRSLDRYVLPRTPRAMLPGSRRKASARPVTPRLSSSRAWQSEKTTFGPCSMHASLIQQLLECSVASTAERRRTRYPRSRPELPVHLTGAALERSPPTNTTISRQPNGCPVDRRT